MVDLFAADVLGRFGLKPARTAGHSYGEYVALAVAGLNDRADLLRLSALRGQAVHEAGRNCPGGMAAVAAPEERTRQALAELGIEAAIANINGPSQTIIGGNVACIDAALRRLPEQGLAVQRIAVSAAFHT